MARRRRTRFDAAGDHVGFGRNRHAVPAEVIQSKALKTGQIVFVSDLQYVITQVNYGEVKVKKVKLVAGKWVRYGRETSVNPHVIKILR